MATRGELVGALAGRYTASDRKGRGRILDEFVAVSGLHRKHAMRLLRAGQPGHRPDRRRARRLYNDAVREALIVIWEASDRVCGKRLRPLVPILVEAMEQHRHLQLTPEVRSNLLAMSAATIDRALHDVKEPGGGRKRRHAPPSAAIRRSVAVRTFDGWDNPPPGFVEADLVAHSGPTATGSFVQTLTLTDIATGWTECAPLLVREQKLLTEVLTEMRERMPFPLLGFDTDNDSVFMNETVKIYCEKAGLVFTRCRPYRKNDQAWVEQKNGAVVRRAVGYRRYEGLEAAAALARLYTTLRLFVDFFQPSFKLAAKARDGAKVRKTYLAPATPCQLGKSTLAQNIAHQALIEGHTVLFTSAGQLLGDLCALDSDSALRRRLRHYARPQLLVIDEVGYLSYSNRHADLMFELVSRLYQLRSTLITTNRPFAEWREVFPNAACVVSLIDRLVHNAEIIAIEGESYRLKEARERTEQRARQRRGGKS